MLYCFIESYEKLKSKVHSGELRILSIVSPPRCSSTALERSLSQNPNIDFQINDPWAIYDHPDRENLTYQYILDKLSEQTNKKTVLIKNIADYLPPGESWLRWVNLCDDQLFLIRNPYLSLHSLLKIYSYQFKPDDRFTPSANMEQYAQSLGYGSLKDLQHYLSKTENYSDFNNLFENTFISDQEIHLAKVMKDPVIQKYIERFGIAGNESDLFKKAFSCRITGWHALYEHYSSLDSAPLVVDSTVLRSDPESSLKIISNYWNIEFSNKMIDWSASKKFETDYDDTVPYYERLVSSASLELPTEAPLPPKNFPKFLQEHLLSDKGAMSIYLDLLSRTDKPSWNKTLYELDPVFDYSIQTTFKLGNAKYQERIKQNNLSFIEVFNFIDNYISNSF